ncbi:MAG: hypothetical protein A2Y78_11265 [Acidobacteria bacterium RBG_13_68_16]|nr:MAG: hypothetical protein A2Y78_11265 [Acidobacteria bacterium RBG_13_68_16]
MRDLRQTGRTTRMLEHAKRLEAEGQVVYVLTASERQADALRAQLGPETSIQVTPLACVIRLRWDTLQIEGAPPNCVVLVDHYVIETRFGKMLEMLHAYDPE